MSKVTNINNEHKRGYVCIGCFKKYLKIPNGLDWFFAICSMCREHRLCTDGIIDSDREIMEDRKYAEESKN